MIAFTIFCLFTIFFWAAFEQAAGSLPIYTRNFTDSSADSAAPSSDKTSENKKYKSLDDAFADLEDL